jgi:hypothetical protein
VQRCIRGAILWGAAHRGSRFCAVSCCCWRVNWRLHGWRCGDRAMVGTSGGYVGSQQTLPPGRSLPEREMLSTLPSALALRVHSTYPSHTRATHPAPRDRRRAQQTVQLPRAPARSKAHRKPPIGAVAVDKRPSAATRDVEQTSQDRRRPVGMALSAPLPSAGEPHSCSAMSVWVVSRGARRAAE